MKQKDKEWSGLFKIPDEVTIETLRKELSDASIEIGKLKSYIDELESGKRPVQEIVDKYYEKRVSVYERAIRNHDSNVASIKKRNKILTDRYINLLHRIDLSLPEKGKVILLTKRESTLLEDLVLAGIAYAKENDVYNRTMKQLYFNITTQLK